MELQTNQAKTIKAKTKIAILTLTIRNFLLQVVSAIGFFLLSYFLNEKQIGLFGIVSEIVGILGYFSDIGLAASLIQKKQEIEHKELKTVFTIQQFLVFVGISLTVLVFILKNGQIDINKDVDLIFLSLVLSFFISSLKTLPSVLLERRLGFQTLAKVDILENLVFYFVAVLFAYLGFGGKSYAFAIVIRSLVGLSYLYSRQSWKIAVGVDLSVLKRLFTFGIPFQLNSFIAIAKDRLSTLYLSQSLSDTSFGYLTWAHKITRMVISSMDAVVRVIFPALSRIQDNPKEIKNILEKTLYGITIISFPLLILVNLFVPYLAESIANYNKWLNALWLLPPLSVYFAIAAITTPLTNAFLAIKQVSRNTKYMFVWLIATWVFYPILSAKYELQGAIFAILLVGFTSLLVWYDAQKVFKINILSAITRPLFITIFSFLPTLFFNNNLYKTFTFLLIFLTTIYKLEFTKIKEFVKR